MISFQTQRPGARVIDIAAAESALAIALPKAYRRFLLWRDGGTPEANRLPSNENVGIDEFFGVGADSGNGLVETARAFRDRIPNEMFPVAESAGGNLVLIATSDGAVWFWDHELESEEDEPASRDNVTRLADAFDQFLNELVPPEGNGDSADVTFAHIDPDFAKQYGTEQ